MKTEHRVDAWVRSAIRRVTLRAGSLIITVYGDLIAPHGGATWLGNLIDLVEPFGLGDRLVRTAVNRLANDDWLERVRAGRKSAYRLTTAGRQRIEHASRRIYAEPRQEWDGQWLIVFLDPPRRTAAGLATLTRELHWEGFGTIARGVLAHPTPDVGNVRELLDGADAAVFSARSLTGLGNAPLRSLVWDAWKLDAVARLYRAFMREFEPVPRFVESGTIASDRHAFVIRTLLIHDFRRILLRDPQLPAALLPSGWPGRAARELCKTVYRSMLDGSERYAKLVLRSVDGPLPPAAPQFYERFGGLLKSSA